MGCGGEGESSSWQDGNVAGTSRPVRRVIYPANSPPAQQVMWEFEGDHPGHWVPYDMEISACLEQAQLAGQQMLDMNTLFQLPYSIHFTTMQQVSWHSTPLPTAANVALEWQHVTTSLSRQQARWHFTLLHTTANVALEWQHVTIRQQSKWHFTPLHTAANVALAACHSQATGKLALHTLTYNS